LNCCSDPVPLLPLGCAQCWSGSDVSRNAATPKQDHKAVLVLWKPAREMDQICPTFAKCDTQVTIHYAWSGQSKHILGCFNIEWAYLQVLSAVPCTEGIQARFHDFG